VRCWPRSRGAPSSGSTSTPERRCCWNACGPAAPSSSWSSLAKTGDLLALAHGLYLQLCHSQSRVRLLHGDLQHYNVLLDARRGWLAIDPKGVVGEPEFEIGTALRNPVERADLFAQPDIVARRLQRFADKLAIDRGRALSWGFAQAVLSAAWTVEDGLQPSSHNPGLLLAQAIRPMLLPVGRPAP
jgi:streptomycin 6-kinase